jgi:hypothetical protein
MGEGWWIERRIEDGDAEGGGIADKGVGAGSWMWKWPAYVWLVNEFDGCDACLETTEGGSDDVGHTKPVPGMTVIRFA